MDDSRYAEELKKPLAAAKKALTPLERAIREKESVNEKQLIDSLTSLHLDEEDSRRTEVGVVLARSLIEGKLTLDGLVKAVKDGQVVLEALKAYKDKKSDKALSRLVQDSGWQCCLSSYPHPPPLLLTSTPSSHSTGCWC